LNCRAVCLRPFARLQAVHLRVCKQQLHLIVAMV
jgi:hypothetical protein